MFFVNVFVFIIQIWLLFTIGYQFYWNRLQNSAPLNKGTQENGAQAPNKHRTKSSQDLESNSMHTPHFRPFRIFTCNLKSINLISRIVVYFALLLFTFVVISLTVRNIMLWGLNPSKYQYGPNLGTLNLWQKKLQGCRIDLMEDIQALHISITALVAEYKLSLCPHFNHLSTLETCSISELLAFAPWTNGQLIILTSIICVFIILFIIYVIHESQWSRPNNIQCRCKRYGAKCAPIRVQNQTHLNLSRNISHLNNLSLEGCDAKDSSGCELKKVFGDPCGSPENIGFSYIHDIPVTIVKSMFLGTLFLSMIFLLLALNVPLSNTVPTLQKESISQYLREEAAVLPLSFDTNADPNICGDGFINDLKGIILDIQNKNALHTNFSTMFVGFYFLFMLVCHLFFTSKGGRLAVASCLSLWLFQFRFSFNDSIFSILGVWCEWMCIYLIIMWTFRQVDSIRIGEYNVLLPKFFSDTESDKTFKSTIHHL